MRIGDKCFALPGGSILRGSRIFLLSCILVSSGFADVTFGASFDCSRASTSIEKAICASQRLSALDSELEPLYLSALANSPDQDALKGEQRNWLKNVRGSCADEACLITAYQQRIAALTSVASKEFLQAKADAEAEDAAEKKIKDETAAALAAEEKAKLQRAADQAAAAQEQRIANQRADDAQRDAKQQLIIKILVGILILGALAIVGGLLLYRRKLPTLSNRRENHLDQHQSPPSDLLKKPTPEAVHMNETDVAPSVLSEAPPTHLPDSKPTNLASESDGFNTALESRDAKRENSDSKTTSHAISSDIEDWFYELDGKRLGAVSSDEIKRLVREGVISPVTMIWKTGYGDWITVKESEFSTDFLSSPPPLPSSKINSNAAYLVASAPLIVAAILAFYDSIFSSSEAALHAVGWISGLLGITAVALNYKLIQLDAERLNSTGVLRQFNLSWIILTPLYFVKRRAAIKETYQLPRFFDTDALVIFSIMALVLGTYYPIAALSNADLLSVRGSIVGFYDEKGVNVKRIEFERNSISGAFGWVTIGPNEMIEATAKCRVNKTIFSSGIRWECDAPGSISLTPSGRRQLGSFSN